MLSISVKSGGDRFSGNWYSDYLSEDTIQNNVPDYLSTANTPNEDGYFSRAALTRGNPVKKQYDLNFSIGGPLWKQKAWFFVQLSTERSVQIHPRPRRHHRAVEAVQQYTLKGTFQLNRSNQVIGYINKREKLQDKRGISLTTPLSAAYYQASRNYPWKWQWTSVLGNRAFLDVLAGNWYNFFPLRPVRDYGLYDGPWEPPRQDTATNQWYDKGGNNGYQDQKRYKPQVYVTMSYFQDGWKGSHDFKFGYDWKRDRRSLFNDQPFDIWYRDNNTALSQVDLFNSSVTGINDVVYHSAWINDTWKVTNRMTLNIGGRFESYRDGWPDQSMAPNGHPALANWPVDLKPADRAQYMAFIAPRDVQATDVAKTNTFSPKVGIAYDLTGRQSDRSQGLCRSVAVEFRRHAG